MKIYIKWLNESHTLLIFVFKANLWLRRFLEAPWLYGLFGSKLSDPVGFIRCIGVLGGDWLYRADKGPWGFSPKP